MNKVVIVFAVFLGVSFAAPQLLGRLPLLNRGVFGPNVIGLRPLGLLGGSGTGAGAGTGSAGPGGVSATGVALSSAQNGGIGFGSGRGTAGLNLLTGQAFATGDGSGQSVGRK